MKSPVGPRGWTAKPHDQLDADPNWSCTKALIHPPISTGCWFRKKRLVVPCQRNCVRVKRRRTSWKNTTVLNQPYTPLFSCLMSSGAGRWPGARVSTNERRAVCPETSTSWALEFVGLKVWQTCYEAPSQDGESSSQPRTPWIDPGEVSVHHGF